MPEQLQTINIELEHPEEVLALFGTNDRFLRHIEQELQVQIVTRGEDIRISGDTKEINLVSDILHTLIQVIQKGIRSEEHTSELQSHGHLVCRLLLEKKNLHV